MQRILATMQRTAALFHRFWFSGIDERVYALIRASLGLTGLINIILMFPLRYTLMADSGIFSGANVPRADLYWSIFKLWSNEPFVDCCIAAAIFATILIIAGVQTRAAMIVFYIWQTSFSHVAFPSLSGYDGMLRYLSFILMFSPLGDAYGYKLLLRGYRPTPRLVSRHGVSLIRIQVTIVYIVACLAKLPDVYWQTGEHWIYFALSTFSNWVPMRVAYWQNLSVVLTYSALTAEYMLPFLLWGEKTKLVGIMIGLALHFGILLIAPSLLVFSMVMAVGYLSFLEKSDIEYLKGCTAQLRPSLFKAARNSSTR